MKLNSRTIVKAAVYIAMGAGCFAMAAYAADSGIAPANSIGDVAGTVTSSISNLVKFVVAVLYTAGIGFTGSGIFKLKQHKDNPQQVPVTTGLAMLALGIALLFMPSILQMGGATLFDTGAIAGGPHGIDTIPGQTTQPVGGT